jgi:Magnesium chelatase, subunit ChlI
MPLRTSNATTCIHRGAGRTGARTAWVTTRPCRAPHHTLSAVGLMGGGQAPMLGAVSLAHHGVRFWDEMPERRHVLEVLRHAPEKSVLGHPSPARPGSRGMRSLSHTGEDREGFGRSTVAARHAPNLWSHSHVTMSPLRSCVRSRPVLFA